MPPARRTSASTGTTTCCSLQWSNISKTVEIREKSSGLLMRSSISHRAQKNNASAPNKKKVILNQISACAHPGQVLAIMGPSGSGKTSLLDVLAGRSTHDSGEIHIQYGDVANETTAATASSNTIRYSRRGSSSSPNTVKQLKRNIAYITQSDSFFGHLTVRDQLTYTALLRLPSSLTTSQKHAEVHRILTLFRLHKCADTQIRKVSGGERKRVNIGTELLTEPLLVLLDEPTTGLDSTSANALLRMLLDLARDGNKTVVTSLHQPSSSMFHSFDRILLLADGCVVYHGTPMDSITYLSERGYECPRGYNAADHWMDLLVEDSALEGDALHHNIENGSDTFEENNDNAYPLSHSKEGETNGPSSQTDGIEVLNGGFTGKDDKMLPPSVGAWRRHSTKRRRSLLAEQLQQSFADLIGKSTPKAQLIEAWRRRVHQEQANIALAASLETEDPASKGELANTTAAAPMVEPPTGERKKKQYNTSWLTQFYVLTHRSMKNSRSAIFTVLNVVKSVCLGIMAGLLWFQMPYTEATVSDRSSYFFFTMTFWVFDSLFGALFAFPAERSVILKERASGSYHLSAYFMAKTLSEAPTRLALPSMYMIISYWMAGINPTFAIFLACIGINLMGVLAGESIGLLVGATILDFEKAMAFLVVLSVTLMVAGGFYIDNIPTFMEWFQYLSPFTYAYFASVQLGFNRNVPCDDSGVLEVVCGQPGTDYATPEEVYAFLRVNGSIAFNTGLLFVLIVVPRTLAFWVLKRKKGGERT